MEVLLLLDSTEVTLTFTVNFISTLNLTSNDDMLDNTSERVKYAYQSDISMVLCASQ